MRAAAIAAVAKRTDARVRQRSRSYRRPAQRHSELLRREINERRIPTARGRDWSPTQVMRSGTQGVGVDGSLVVA